jgi:hypothetical protein
LLNNLTKTQIESIRLQMRNERDQHLPVWKLLSMYIAPRRLKDDGCPRIDGRRKDQHIIRNTAGQSLRTFVSGMQNGATPRSRPWFDMVTSNPQDMKSSRVQNYLEDSEQIMQNHLQVSNFYRVMPLAYKDIGVFSNSAFAMLPHPRYGFYFYPYTIGTYAYSTDPEGNANMFTRDTVLTVRQTVETFGQLGPTGQINWSNFDPSIKNAWESARYLDEVTVAQVILPNPNYNPVAAKSAITPLASKYQSFTYMTAMNGQAGGIPFQGGNGFRDEASIGNRSDYLKVTGYNYFPVIVGRWEQEAEGSYGIDGPGHIALSDIITLQEQEKLRMEGSYKLVKPPMVGHAALRRHQSSILAGGITYLDDRGMNLGFKPAFTVGPALADLVQNKEEVESMIRSAFYEDIFLMLNSQGVKTHVTKAEINERSAERMSILSPVLGQLDFDITSKVINNGIRILEDQERLPQRPDELVGRDLRPEYTSILAQASKASLINTQERFINFLASYAQATSNPALMAIVDDEAFIREYASNIGLNPKLMADEDAFAAALEAAAQNAAQQQQLQTAQIQADSANKLANTPLNNGSLLDTLAQASSA